MVEAEWWTSFIALEWMTEEEYTEAGESFDMSTQCFKSSTVDKVDLDEEILRAQWALLELNKDL